LAENCHVISNNQSKCSIFSVAKAESFFISTFATVFLSNPSSLYCLTLYMGFSPIFYSLTSLLHSIVYR